MKYLYAFLMFILISNIQLTLASTNKGTATQSLIKALEKRIHSYELKKKRFPSTAEGLQEVLKNKSSKKVFISPVDNWGNPIIYRYPAVYGSKMFDLYSFGKNGTDNFGKGDDITNWNIISTKHYYPVKWIFNNAIFIFLLVTVIFIFVKSKVSRAS